MAMSWPKVVKHGEWRGASQNRSVLDANAIDVGKDRLGEGVARPGGHTSLLFGAAGRLRGSMTRAQPLCSPNPLSGDLGQGSRLDPLLSYSFLGTYHVLGALCGFSNLNFTVIVL